MASRIEVKKKRVTKRDRSKVKGTARRRKVTVRNRGKGSANVAIVGKR